MKVTVEYVFDEDNCRESFKKVLVNDFTNTDQFEFECSPEDAEFIDSELNDAFNKPSLYGFDYSDVYEIIFSGTNKHFKIWRVNDGIEFVHREIREWMNKNATNTLFGALKNNTLCMHEVQEYLMCPLDDGEFACIWGSYDVPDDTGTTIAIWSATNEMPKWMGRRS